MNFRTLLYVGASVLAVAPSGLLAQEAPRQPADTVGVEDIVVTAQKRSENLQKVPISVAAITANALKAAGVTNSTEINTLVPGLVFTNSLGAGVAYIRGVGQTTAIPGAESPVGIYVDGIYLLAPASGLFDFNNIERVEVLRGPQGTLFGRNTTGGVINIITRNPDDRATLDADIGYANFDTISGRLYASTPIAEGLGISISAFGTHRRDGFGRNVTLDEELFEEKSFGVQGKLRWESTDGATAVTASYMHSYNRSDFGITYGVPPGSVGGDGSLYLGRYTFASSIHEPSVNRQNLASLRIEHDLGFARIVNLAGYHTLKQQYRFAQLGYDNNSLAATNPYAAQYPNLIATDKTFTEEFQIQAPSDSKMQWIAGLYYLHDHIPNLHTESKPNNVLRINVDTEQKVDSFAAFAQVTYPVLDSTRITAGIRWTTETKKIWGETKLANGTVVSTPDNPGSGADPLPPKTNWKRATYRLAIDHDLTDDILGYASYNRGFKGGVYNLALYTNQPAKQEIVDAFEAGLKMMLFDRRLRLNLSAFYMDYKDIQLRTPVAGLFAINNAAKARVKGVDVDFEAAISEPLTLRGGFEVLDAKYRSFPKGLYTFPNPISADNLPANCQAPAAYNSQVGGNTQLTCDLSGNRMIRSPKFTANFGFNYRLELSGGSTIALAANDAYNSGYYFDADNRLKQDAYHDVSASLTWTSAKGTHDVQLWVKNLADETIFTTATGGVSDTYSPGLPRTYGVKLGVHF